MPRRKPKNRNSAESTKVIVSDEEVRRLQRELIDRGCDYREASAFITSVNGAAVHAYILSGQFPSVGEEKAWCQSVLKEIDQLDNEKLVALLQKRNDFEDLQAMGEVIAKLGVLKGRIQSRKDKLDRLNVRGRREGRTVLAEELVRLWRVHFHETPKYPLPKRTGEVAPFLYVLREIVRVAEGLDQDSISIDYLRKITSEAIKADQKNFRKEFQTSFLT